MYPHFLIHGVTGSLLLAMCLYPASPLVSIWYVLGVGFIQGVSLDVQKQFFGSDSWHKKAPFWTFPGGHAHMVYDYWLHQWKKWWKYCWHLELGLWFICTMGLILMFRVW